MAITKEKKKEILGNLKSALKDAASVVFVNFHGLTVIDTSNLRNKLREAGVSYFVAKKTIVKRALSEEKIEGDMPELEGELAIAYGKDLIAPARGIYEFQKKHKGSIAIIGGIFEKAYKNKEEMVEIASIPEPQVLRGMFVNVINSPIQGLAAALDAIAQKKA